MERGEKAVNSARRSNQNTLRHTAGARDVQRGTWIKIKQRVWQFCEKREMIQRGSTVDGCMKMNNETLERGTSGNRP